MKKKIISVISVALVAVVLVAALVACGPASNPDKALSALKDNGYTAAKDDTVVPAALTLLGVKGIDCVVSGTNVSDESVESVTIVYFTSSDAANEAWSTVRKYATEKNSSDNKGDPDTDFVINKSGKMIYYGTSAGVKAAR